MKKTIYAIAMMLMTGISAFSQTEDTKVILQSGANTTIYDGTQISTAIGAAKKGDILYLSEGTYDSFTIDKEILVRGVGENTWIEGDVTIAIPNNATLTQAVLEGVNVSGTINITQPATNLIIRNTKVMDIKVNGALSNGLIDRCWITRTFNMNNNTDDTTVKNSKVLLISAGSLTYNKCTFLNCNIAHRANETTAAVFTNCIIGGKYDSKHGGTWYYGLKTMESSVFTNTLFNTYEGAIGSSSSQTNCYLVNDSYGVCDCGTLESRKDLSNYLGTDGTQVGVYGGTTPFTLDPQVAKVTESTFTVDTDAKKLTVKLKVAAK
ncbi:MAG: hypothetical protein SOZ58_02470 [Prevotella sp.]|nr:hypothetical protein [Prevotella sp.]